MAENVAKTISLPRGDIRKIKFCIRSGSGLRTDMQEIYFTVKNNFRKENPIFQKRLSTGEITLGDDNYYHLTIKAEDTNDQDYGSLVYDIEIVKLDEDIKQTVTGILKITEESTYASNE